MKIWEDYHGFNERMCHLREMEIGLDGAICAKGGEVRVHLPYMAACNQTLFNRITSLMKQGRTELNASSLSLTSVQLIVEYCYSGEIEVTEDNFVHIIDAALWLEFPNVVDECIDFALESKANANLWCHFLRAAFKHPRLLQPNQFIPNLILDNIIEIPEEAIMKGLNPVYIREILEHGTLTRENRCYALNLFLEMILADKADIQVYRETIALMGKIVVPGDKLRIPVKFTDRSIIPLMELSLQISFPSLVEACVEALMVLPTTAQMTTQVLQWTKQYARSACLVLLNKFVFHAFSNLPMDTAEDDLSVMLDNDCLGQMSEFEIFKTTLKWLEHSDASAETNCRVMSLIRFGLMEKEEVDFVVKGRPIAGCAELLVSAMRYHLNPHEQPLNEEGMNKMRKDKAATCMYLIGGKDSANNYNKEVLVAHVFHQEEEQTLSDFTELCETPITLSESACAEVNGFIFVIGGVEISEIGKSLFRFDPRTNTWLELQEMKEHRKGHTLTALDGNLMVVGGECAEKDLDSLEMYDVKRNTWTYLDALPEKRSQHAASCVDSILYVSGGTWSKTLFSFSDEVHVWERKSPMLQTRQAHIMTGVSGMLIVAGGAVNVNNKFVDVMSTECYDITQDQWTELSPAINPSCLGSSVRINNWFYVIGGFSVNKSTKLNHVNRIQRYDIQTNEWELCDSKLPSKMTGMSAACISFQ